MSVPQPPVLVITDRRTARLPLPVIVRQALQAGCRWVMVREKDLPADDLLPLVQQITVLASSYAALVSVNGSCAVAARCGTAALHLPQGYDVQLARRELGASALIGVSTHSDAEAHAAVAAGASYVCYSPIYPTISKPGYGPALGPVALARLASELPVPVIALGGITPATAGACRWAGAAGIAVQGSVMQAADPAAAVAGLLSAWEDACNRQ